MRKFVIYVSMLLVFFIVAQTVEACEPTPPPPPPQPKPISCASLGKGYKFGFRLTGARNGEYTLTPDRGKLTGGAPADKYHAITISNSDGKVFDWDASLGIDAVIVTANNHSTATKRLEARSGNDIHAPKDSKGRLVKIQYVEFCYDYELSISQTVNGTVGQAAGWEITKEASPAEQVKFAGESAKFDYTVAVKSTGPVAGGYQVDGQVKIQNRTPLTATITSIQDTLIPGDVPVTLDCGGVKLPYRLSAWKELTCTYSKTLDSKLDGSNRVVVLTSGSVGPRSSTQKIKWTDAAAAAAPAVEAAVAAESGSITVTDTNPAFNGPRTATADTTWTYSVDLSCPTDPAKYTGGKATVKLPNTATIVETGQTASKEVTLTCYAPDISQTTSTSYASQYFWSINKTSPTEQLGLQVDETSQVNYTVTVDVANQVENAFKVSGEITVANPHPSAPMTVSLADAITPNLAGAPAVPATLIDCADPLTIPAGGSQVCKFEADLSAKIPGSSVATATFNNIAFTHAAPYNFGTTNQVETDECINVTDDKAGPLGTVCAGQTPKTFNYTLTVGPFTACGDWNYINIASFVTNDTKATGSAQWEVKIPIPCANDNNCTYDPTYWKANSNPAVFGYDKTWDQILPSGPASPFYETGKTWLEIYNQDPMSSKYIALAQQYMSARLNNLHGAVLPAEARAALEHADALLAEYDTHRYDVVGAVYTDFTNTADTLNSFNLGESGPGTCCPGNND